MKKTTECSDYIGKTCLIGGCPILSERDEVGQSQRYKRHCKNCFLNDGCSDCYFATETGCRLVKSNTPMSKNPTATASCNNELVRYRIVEDPNGLPINPQLFELLSRYSGDPRGAEGIPGDITYDLGGALRLLDDCRDRIIYGPDECFVCIPQMTYDFCIEQIEKALGQKRRIRDDE